MTVEERLSKLERTGRRWKAVATGLALLLVVGVTVAQTRPEVADVLRCRRLEVVDAQGKTRAGLFVGEQLTIYSRLWPRQFLADFERTGEALWLYLYLLTWRDPRTGYVRGSLRKTVAKIGVSAVQIGRWLEQLEEEGYLEDESLNGKLVVRLMV